MNVKFFNSSYVPTEEELKKLKKMQELIHFTRVQYLYEIRNESPRMKAARIANLPRLYRERWKVYGPDDELSPEHQADLENFTPSE